MNCQLEESTAAEPPGCKFLHYFLPGPETVELGWDQLAVAQALLCEQQMSRLALPRLGFVHHLLAERTRLEPWELSVLKGLV